MDKNKDKIIAQYLLYVMKKCSELDDVDLEETTIKEIREIVLELEDGNNKWNFNPLDVSDMWEKLSLKEEDSYSNWKIEKRKNIINKIK